MAWDKRWLEGRVYTQGVRETAEKFIPEMRAKGAELVVAISHGGLDDSPYSPTMENGNYYLSQVPGVDAMLIGHSHQLFPNAASTVPQFNLPGVDKVKGLVNGVPTVMANLWGKHLGVIGLRLRHDGKQWVIDKSATTVEARGIQNADKSYVAARSCHRQTGGRGTRGDDRLRADAGGRDGLPHVDVFRRRGRRQRHRGGEPGASGLSGRVCEGELAAVCAPARAVDVVAVQERLGRRVRLHGRQGGQCGAE